MAKKKQGGRATAPARKDPAEVLAKLETPQVRWRLLGLIAVALVVLWGLASGLVPYIGYWGLVGMGAVTLGLAGFGIYAWRLTRRSRAIVDILKGATDEAGREAALEKLSAAKDSDAMAKLAQAQLVSQQDPAEAIRILEAVELEKAPGVVQDDVRANLALLYLMNGRPRDARPLADEIRLDRQPQAKGKALYAAVTAETFARTGKGEEARKLLETFDPTDPEFGEVAALLYRAQVYTFMSAKKRGLAKQAMQHLAGIDPNMVAAFALKGAKPELQKMARQVVQAAGVMPRQKMKVVRR